MLKIIRSRRIPALLTRMSRRPNSSSVWVISRSAATKSVMSSLLATARPPRATISPATNAAASGSRPVPSSPQPRSLTNTAAPSAASARDSSRPIPPPPPVTIATRPSRVPISGVGGEVLVDHAVHVDHPALLARVEPQPARGTHLQPLGDVAHVLVVLVGDDSPVLLPPVGVVTALGHLPCLPRGNPLQRPQVLDG